MKTPLLLLVALLGFLPVVKAADAFLLYDSSTKIVSAPSAFWRSNLVDTSELTFSISGGRVTPQIAASIARDSEVTSEIAAAISSLTSLYQPLDADLTALAALNGAGLTNLNASTAFSSGQVPIARLATGTPTGSKFIRDDGTLAVPAGGGTGDVVGPASSTDSVVALYDGTTGKLLKNGTLTEAAIATDSEVAAGYQPLDADLTDLASSGSSGSGSFVRSTSPTIASPLLSGIVTVDGTVSPFTNKTRVVFEGDSLSLMTTPESQVGWPSYFTNRMASLNLIYGTNAATTGQQVNQMQTDYAAQIAPWAPAGGTNAILFFWGGVNDLYYSNSWSIAFQRITNYWATAKASGYQLVGFEVTDSTNLTANARSQLPLLNDALRRHARTYCDWFINTTELFHDALDTNWVTAGVHYTSAANRLLADYVRWNLLQGGDYHANAFGARAAPANYFRSIQLVSNSVPQTMQGGMLAWDADAYASGRGALVAHDGTTNTIVVAVQATDTPSNGQVPKWNTDGTITWEDDSTGSSSSVFVNASSVTGPNISTGPYSTVSVASGTNITVQPTRVPVSAITFASTNSIDLTVSQKFTLLVTNDTTFASGTISNGVSVLVLMTSDSTARNLSFPAGWTFLNVPAPTQLAASKSAVLALETFGTSATNVYASFAAQP